MIFCLAYFKTLKMLSGVLWERICRREFPREQRQEFESWREVYDRCLAARQEKLDFLTVKVQQSYKKVSLFNVFPHLSFTNFSLSLAVV
jgi:RNA polymerase II transcription factor SIII (Elongin) subunit A